MTIAEESTSWGGVSHPTYNGGLGFSMKWDMGWMNDTLRYMERDPIHRRHHQNELTFRSVYHFSENYLLPISHDEVVHGKKSLIAKMPGDFWQQFANLRALLGYQWLLPGKKLLFMGCELGQWTEWNHDAELDWALVGQQYHDGLRRYVGDLNKLYSSRKELHATDCDPAGWRWISADDSAQSILSFMRSSPDGTGHLVVVFNFTPAVREGYRIGVPVPGFYREALNSDASIYGGTNVGNQGGVYTDRESSHGFDQSISITLPPLGVAVFDALTGPQKRNGKPLAKGAGAK